MKIIFLLIAVSLCVALFFLGAFIWSVNDDQYDDSYGDARRLLHEEDDLASKERDRTKTTSEQT